MESVNHYAQEEKDSRSATKSFNKRTDTKGKVDGKVTGLSGAKRTHKKAEGNRKKQSEAQSSQPKRGESTGQTMQAQSQKTSVSKSTIIVPAHLMNGMMGNGASMGQATRAVATKTYQDSTPKVSHPANSS
jgi:hypothetical protein